MAISDADLAQLRLMIDEADSSMWSDTALSVLYDTNGSDLRKTASVVWEAKAASYVNLVNTTESGSSRSMSQQFDHAMTMAKQFGTTGETEPDTVANAPRSTKIVRATREG